MFQPNRSLLPILLCVLACAFAPLACGDDSSPDSDQSGDVDPGQDAGTDAAGTDAAGTDATSTRSDVHSHPHPDDCLNPITREVLELTNASRDEVGLGPLKCDKGLREAAEGHAQDMCDNDYFSHDSQDGREFDDRINAAHVRWTAVGENIAWGQSTPAEVHDAWMHSEGHRANILSPSYGRLGVGYVECEGRPYWVEDFAN